MSALPLRDFMLPEYEACRLCPKNCGVNRNAGETGFCRETNVLRLSWAGLHFGEEPPITGNGGSGTVFITGCNLRCSFCQNYQISQEGIGKAVGLKEFTALCLKLQERGAENINIVTGSHAAPALAEGLKNAKKEGLCIPVLWNTSAYETEETVALLSPVVDGWLPDIKTFDSKTARLLFKSEDYPETAAAAILKMAESTPLTLRYGRAYPFGKMESGVIVRHLALPGCLKDTENILRWYARLLKEKTLLSLMTQYTPIKARALTGFSDGHFGAQTDGISAVPPALKTTSFQNRMLCADDDAGLKRLLTELKIDSGFYQELNPSDDWLPDFNRIRTFSAALSKPLWHWTCGFIK